MILSDQEKREAIEKTREILAQYGSAKEHLIPVLQQIQSSLGYVPPDAMQEAARHFNLPAVDVYSIVTFYNQFRRTPPGKNQIKICMGTACHMKGAGIIMDSWERVLKIKVGETTPDREFSLERVACVGCCTLAPVAVLNETVHGKMTPTKVDGMLFSHQLANQQHKEGEHK